MNRLTESLWIGDISDARERPLRELGIDTVVTVCQDPVDDNISSDLGYYWFDIADGEAASKWGGSSEYSAFRVACETVLANVREGRVVFVHCHHGASRSAAVCIGVEAVLRGDKPVSPKALYNEVEYEFQQERSIINPDPLLRDHALRFITEYR